MNAEQKQRALDLIDVTKTYRLDAEECAMQMAALLQELVDSPEPEPVAYLIDWPEEPEIGHCLSEEPNDSGRSRPLYTAPPAPSVPLVLPEMSKNHIECIALDAGIEYCGDGVWRASPASMRDFAQRCINDAIPAAPPTPRLSDERILEICGFRPESAVEVGADIIRKRWLEIARAIEREILGGGECTS